MILHYNVYFHCVLKDTNPACDICCLLDWSKLQKYLGCQKSHLEIFKVHNELREILSAQNDQKTEPNSVKRVFESSSWCRRTFSHHGEVNHLADKADILIVFKEEDAVEEASVGARVIEGDVEHVYRRILDVFASFSPVPIQTLHELFVFNHGAAIVVAIDLEPQRDKGKLKIQTKNFYTHTQAKHKVLPFVPFPEFLLLLLYFIFQMVILDSLPF